MTRNLLRLLPLMAALPGVFAQMRETPDDILKTSRYEKPTPPDVERPPANSKKGPPIDPGEFRNYNRGPFISAIYAQEWDNVPYDGGLGAVRFLASTFGEFRARCPNLKREIDNHPKVISNLMATSVKQGVRQATRSTGWDETLALISGVRSPEAQDDVDRLLKEYGGCDAPVPRFYVSSLITYAELLPALTPSNNVIPAANAPEGGLYRQMIANCERSIISEDSGRSWCPCYARAVVGAHISREMLTSLANNPFVDHRTFLRAIAEVAPAFPKLVRTCGMIQRRELQNRRTAFLLTTVKNASGKTECVYDSAYGKFTVQQDPFDGFAENQGWSCETGLFSNFWGSKEVSCSGAVRSQLPPSPFRRYKAGQFTSIDYESNVQPGFVPPIPEFQDQELPIEITVLRQASPGSLKRVRIGLSYNDVTHSSSPDVIRTITRDLDAIYRDARTKREPGVTLSCLYVSTHAGFLDQRSYWLGQIPSYVVQNRDQLSADLEENPLLKLRARENCPASPQPDGRF